jgi:hypothetical protein
MYKAKLSPDWGKTHIDFECPWTDFKLCYVQNNLAYFTSGPLEAQWGDDSKIQVIQLMDCEIEVYKLMGIITC